MDKQCPLCGKSIEEHEIFCSDCNDNAEKRASLDFFSEEENNTNNLEDDNTEKQINNTLSNNSEITDSTDNIPPLKKGKKTKKVLVVFSILLLILATLGIGIIFFTNEQAKERNEELSFWYKCIEENTPLAYSNYLSTYPDGEFSKQARKKITELREDETNERETLRNTTDLDAYYSFLNKYPDSPFRKEVLQIMDSLSWEKAQQENTTESYLAYVNNSKLDNIAGEFIAIAESRYRYLTSLKNIEAEELGKVKKIIEDYFEILSDQEYERFPEFLNPVIRNFYGQKSIQLEVLIKSIQTDMEKNAVKYLTYTPDFTTFSATQDSTGTYLVHLPVEKNFIYKVKDKKPEKTKEKLRIELTPEMKVFSMFINEDKNIVW